MIVLLHADDEQAKADQIAADLMSAFAGHIDVQVMPVSSLSAWPRPVDWDDLLLIVYGATAFPEPGDQFIAEYLRVRNGRGSLLPVALSSGHPRPPSSASAIKALVYDEAARGVAGRLVRRVGSMIGLRVQQRDNQIFISYRASDGTPLATQLEDHLKGLGYPVWRDEATELDGETKILPGSPVQLQIDEALEQASIVLLLDTPDAPHSPWIKHEVDTANALLLPVLPVVFRVATDHRHGPRFLSLLSLQRWISMAHSPPATVLMPEELDTIVKEMETYLCEIFQRKCRVPFLVEKQFVSRNYSWGMLDQRLLISEAKKTHGPRVTTRVLSHCSIFDQVHGPGLERFAAFLKTNGHSNHTLYIYDGEILPEPQLKEIIDARPADEGVIILHHQELAALIDSNFTMLSV